MEGMKALTELGPPFTPPPAKNMLFVGGNLRKES